MTKVLTWIGKQGHPLTFVAAHIVALARGSEVLADGTPTTVVYTTNCVDGDGAWIVRGDVEILTAALDSALVSGSR